MIAHRDAIELAATSLDFALDDADRKRLDEHLLGCESCRLEAAGLHRDAAALASLPELAPPTWVRTAIGRPHGPRRAVLLAAAAAVLTLTVGVALAVGAVLRDEREQPPVPSAPPTVPSVAPSRGPSAEISPSASAAVGPFPVAKPTSFPVGAGSARMTAGPDGGLWIVVNQPAEIDGAASTTVIGLLDQNGLPRSGWPVALDGWACDADTPPHDLAIAADGSLRLICEADVPDTDPRRHVALAFDIAGRLMPGWPVELAAVELRLWPVVAGDELRVLGSEIESTDGSTAQSAAWWLIGIAADGTVRTGTRYEVADAAGSFDVRIASNGVGYRVAVSGGPDQQQSAITAFDFGGVIAGWPVTVEGSASHPVVGPNGSLVIGRRLSQGDGARAQTMTISPSGGDATATTDGLPIDPLDDRTGAGAEVLPPIIAQDGAIFVIGSDASGERVFVVNPPTAGRGVVPASLKMPLQPMGVCSGQDIGCGVWRALPVVGPDGTLYVPESAVGEGGGLVSSSGGSLVALGPDGKSPKGWPVFLPDTMAGFWSLMARPDGTVDALAVVPTDQGNQWSLVILGPDGATRASTVLILP